MGIGVSANLSVLKSSGGGAWFTIFMYCSENSLSFCCPIGQLDLQILHVLE